MFSTIAPVWRLEALKNYHKYCEIALETYALRDSSEQLALEESH